MEPRSSAFTSSARPFTRFFCGQDDFALPKLAEGARTQSEPRSLQRMWLKTQGFSRIKIIFRDFPVKFACQVRKPAKPISNNNIRLAF
jgi:hypothetical protein